MELSPYLNVVRFAPDIRPLLLNLSIKISAPRDVLRADGICTCSGRNCDEPMYAKFFLRGSETFNETFFGGHQLFLFSMANESW
jgi:hypothetical protein